MCQDGAVCAATGAGTGAGSSTKTTFWSACGKKERRDGGFGRVLNVETPECREIRKNFDRMNRMNEVFGVKTRKTSGENREWTPMHANFGRAAVLSGLLFSTAHSLFLLFSALTLRLARGDTGPPEREKMAGAFLCVPASLR